MGYQAYWKEGNEQQESNLLYENEMQVKMLAIAENEQVARMVVSAFVAPVNPTLEELNDVKTAVSEAVTNAVIHGYPDAEIPGYVYLDCQLKDGVFYIVIEDNGVGIENVEQARQPLYTSKPEMERSGMGFAFMEAFMDELKVSSSPGQGVTVTMKKRLGKGELDE